MPIAAYAASSRFFLFFFYASRSRLLGFAALYAFTSLRRCSRRRFRQMLARYFASPIATSYQPRHFKSAAVIDISPSCRRADDMLS